jgi:hypothetical protein
MLPHVAHTKVDLVIEVCLPSYGAVGTDPGPQFNDRMRDYATKMQHVAPDKDVVKHPINGTVVCMRLENGT